MADAVGIDALQLDRAAPAICGVAALWRVRRSCVWLGIVEAKDPGPLLDGLVVVGWVQGRIGTSMIDLHLWIAAGVARVHVLDHLVRVSVCTEGGSPDVSNAILTPAQTCGVLWI